MTRYENVCEIRVLSADESERASGALASIEVIQGNEHGTVLLGPQTRLYTNGHLVPNLHELTVWFSAHREISCDVKEVSRSGFTFAETARFTSAT